jgi:hypothetical protein
VNKLISTGFLIDEKKHKRLVLTEERLEDTGVRLEHTHRKSLKCLSQNIGASKGNTIAEA